MHLEQALAQITEIRAQIARSETFRGYRSLTIAGSGLLGLAAAFWQSWMIPDPRADLLNYINLWSSVALVSLLIVGVELTSSCWRAVSPRTTRLTLLAVQQFVPCLVAGGLVTWIISGRAPESGWMLPGLWASFFGLGVFASCRLLPRPTFWVGVYYVGCGCLSLWIGDGAAALSPWMMGLTFGGGQLLTAGILYWTLERPDGQK